MRKLALYFCLVSCCFSCSKSSTTNFNGIITEYAPVPVSKAQTKRVFAHILTWFETSATNSTSPNLALGDWGEHWTMTNQNPNTFTNLADTQRNIASWYYPMIGPYASGDTAVIDYQLLMMKLSGIDGVFIDWYGIGTNAGQVDYHQIVTDTKNLVSRIGAVGLKYAIVYEDQALSNYSTDSATVLHAQADMEYMQANFFQDPNYETVSGVPLLLNFGPQHINKGSEWDSVFSVLPIKPMFFTLSDHSSLAAGAADGEFVWVYANALSSLNSFYTNSYTGTKMSAAFSGFNSFYAAGGESGGPGPTLSGTPEPSVSFFQQTLDLALQQANNNYIQLATWNDYGEGTIIEPTKQFGYSYLTTLQQELGVASLSISDLEAVTTLYHLRVNNVGNTGELNKLNQAYYYMVSLQMDKARSLLN